jgi:penicillin V acylase-like amidase (Ntn superfamily)
MRFSLPSFCLAVVALLAAPSPITRACTRLVFIGADNEVITARSMDWKVDVGTNLYILPRGIARSGEAGPNSLKWIAKYGSVVATGYDVSTTDGMNERGLAAALLWLVESKYPAFGRSSKPGLTIAAWAQYVLDNFASVNEAVAALEKQPFTIVTASVPGEQRLATLHLAISDATGDSAIVEYINARQVIHHGRQYQVMTNSPIFDQQLALNEYWKQIGGTTFLPGTNRSSDRFARAAFYVNAIPKDEDSDKALASVFGVIRNVSVPFGINTPEEPNISSTRWRTVADQKRMLYFFESALTPNTFWVDLKKIDFSAAASVKRLDLGKDQRNTFQGEVSSHFQASLPFHFLGLQSGQQR